MRGYNVWWDTSLVAGDAFGDKINAQLDQAKLVLTLWSQGALSSPWVKAESQRAWEQRKYLGILMESYQRHLTLTDMSPLSHSDRCDCAGLVDEVVPSVAPGVEDGFVILEDAV